MSQSRPEMIRERLERAFDPQIVDVVDDSHRHAGHASAGGAGHFRVSVVSNAFAGKGLLERHRMVYAAVEDIMGSEIHALNINAMTPDEASA